MAVYPFISFGWSGLLVKPRFDIRDDRLEIINRPLPTPDEILNAVAPSQLPKIEYDPGDANEDWAWRFDRGPMLVRLVTSISPRWPDRKAQGNASIETLNVRLLEELIRMVERDNARPVVVLLPRWKGEDDIAKTVLAKIDHPYLDAKACLTAVPEQARRVPSGAHYSRQGNRAIALCALPFVRCALDHATCNYGCLRNECPQPGVQEGYRAPAKGRPDAENEPEPVSSNVPIRQEGKARP